MTKSIQGIIALTLSAILVHGFYVILVEPNVALAEVLILQGDADQQRSIWIILKDFEQEACLILMFWAIYLMAEKFIHITKTDYLFEVDFFKNCDMSSTAISTVVDDLENIKGSVANTPLIRALKVCLRRFLISQDIHATAEVIEAECVALANKNEAENSMIRYLIWAIPSIGFIGTVRGIGQALAQADKALAGDITGMTNSLGVAFNSTLVALFVSMILMFLLYQLQRAQDSLTVSVNDYCHNKVLDPLSRSRLK
ncbi:MAG: MotA/TolQ/ExbB proton channel family protein [Gammaproteobacteria bacterium]|nr:MotA/TolQ/ExbB proton channel family protein [Gammaproteobacteria bacterium]